MKPALIVAACLATLVAYTTAQIAPLAGVAAPVIPPIMPPMFAGMPFPFFGPFGPLGMLGLGGFGFGLGGLGLGLGLGGIGGIGRFGLGGLGGLGGIGGIGGIRRFGKRDVDSFKTIKCTIGAKCFDCTFGFGQRMACNVEPRLGGIEDSLKLRLVGLGVSGKSSEGVKFVELISKKDSSYTFVNPSTDKPVSLAIFWGDLDKTGFQVKDKTCWETLLKTVGDDGREVKVNLIL